MLVIKNSDDELLNLGTSITIHNSAINPQNLVVIYPGNYVYEVEGLSVDTLQVIKEDTTGYDNEGYQLAMTVIHREWRVVS